MRNDLVRHMTRTATAGLLTALVTLTAGCGKSVTAPQGATIGNDLLEITIRFETVLCVADGDPRPLGAGLFTFSGSASYGTTNLVYGTVPGDPVRQLVRLRDGQVHPLDWTARFLVTHGSPGYVQFRFGSTNWERDAAGHLVPNPALNNIGFTVRIPSVAFDSGLLELKLGGPDCQVESRFRVISKRVGAPGEPPAVSGAPLEFAPAPSATIVLGR